MTLFCSWGFGMQGENEPKGLLRQKIKAALKEVFDTLEADVKNELFGEEGQQQNNFNLLVNQIENYFVDHLENGSDFLNENAGSVKEDPGTGFFKFLGPKITRTANVGTNTYLLELLKDGFYDSVNYHSFYTNPQGTLTENISQYYKENSCDHLCELYLQLIHPSNYSKLEGLVKNIVDYVLENIFALFPKKCWGLLETKIDQKFLSSLWELRMNGTLRKYLYFYKNLSFFDRNIQFRFIRHGILMNAMVDFVAAATIVKKGVVKMRTIFDNNNFLTEKIFQYVYSGALSKKNDAELLADYLIRQINNPAWYYIHQHFYKTALLTGVGFGGLGYLLYKYRHKLPNFKKSEQNPALEEKITAVKVPENSQELPTIDAPNEEIITLPDVVSEVSENIQSVPETVKKSWGESLREYFPKPWKSTLDVPQPRLEIPHG